MNKSHLAQIKLYGGEEGYRQHMREIRSKVISHPGGSFNDKDFARHAQKLSIKAKAEKKKIEEAHQKEER